MTAKDIAAFAKDSARNSVVVLGPTDFPNRVVNSRDPWVVDFYAPVGWHALMTQMHFSKFFRSHAAFGKILLSNLLEPHR